MGFERWMMKSAITLVVLALFDLFLFCIGLVLERRRAP